MFYEESIYVQGEDKCFLQNQITAEEPVRSLTPSERNRPELSFPCSRAVERVRFTPANADVCYNTA
jgi:hypothetical protein